MIKIKKTLQIKFKDMEVIKRNIKAKETLNRGKEILKPKLIITWIISVYEKVADADEID